MFRKLRIIIVTFIIKILHPRNIKINGLQDLRFDTVFSIYNDGQIDLGRQITAFRNVTFSVNGGLINIGEQAFFNRNCLIVAMDEITIGKKCIFGPNVMIYDHDHRFNANGVVDNDFNRTPVMIEENCWVGANVTILRGTHIGKGCVIGAGCVLQGTIPDHSIVRSNRDLIIEPLRTNCDKQNEKTDL